MTTTAIAADVQKLAASYCGAALARLLSIARDEKAPMTARKQAAKTVARYMRPLPDDISKLLEK